MTPAFLKVSIGGRNHTALRKQIDSYLLTVAAFQKMRIGRKLINHFYRHRPMSSEEASDIVNALKAIEKAFASRAHIREIQVSCFPNVYIQLRC